MEVIASVSNRYNTYTAKFGSRHKASCTAGAQQAVERLGEKIFGEHQRFTVTEIERKDGEHLSYWRITTDPSQACRVCGCTWDKGCEGGCSWVDADLCSNCAQVLEAYGNVTHGG